MILERVADVRAAVRAWRGRGERVGLVPTMGYLHAGHQALVKQCRELCPHVVVSIYVNPTQFGIGEDFERYPRDLEGDCEKARAAGAERVFAPANAEMYPAGFDTIVQVERLTQGLCGVGRPTHFRGVTTVVCKLLNIVQPDVAVFGEKDYQQLAVIRRMVRDLDLPVEIVAGATVREPDGLAMSSRNAMLAPDARVEALTLSRALAEARAAVAQGERSASAIVQRMRTRLQGHAVRVEYLEIVDPVSLEPLTQVTPGRARALVAAHVGDTRLIDGCAL